MESKISKLGRFIEVLDAYKIEGIGYMEKREMISELAEYLSTGDYLESPNSKVGYIMRLVFSVLDD